MISVTKLNAGTAYNIIPEHAEMVGTVRTFAPGLRDFAERQMRYVPKASRAHLGQKSSSSTGGSNLPCSTTLRGSVWPSRRHAVSWGQPL